MTEPLELWRYWFRTLRREDWFTANPDTDAALQGRFGELPDLARDGALLDWRESPRGTVALILALDQLPRNLWRGEARAFAYDAQARAEARAAIERGVPSALSVDEQLFLYLPFEHSERLADQDLACCLIGALGDEVYTDFAERHRAVIRRFGRFPHRNPMLRRVSTPDEAAYLADPDAGF